VIVHKCRVLELTGKDCKSTSLAADVSTTQTRGFIEGQALGKLTGFDTNFARLF